MAIEIPDSAAFYIRGSMNRALQQMRDLLEQCKRVIAEPDKVSALERSMVSTEMGHWQQWYKEAVAEFRQLPESIRPDRDLLDYEV